ncbi:SRPBCC family protein [Streptomyces kronopolitis]|uniref:SRPBCC family protein n=1 Tax=Streptomyces kronopolitis TaxID=1612435 RepID=UPI003D9922BC
MAVRHQLIKRAPAAVRAVLSDASRYADWVVGTAHSRPDEGRWPEPDSTLAYTVRVGPWTLNGHTVVRRCEPPENLELEVDSGPLGTARIAIYVRPWGEHTFVIVDEHPLAGPGGTLHNAALDTFLQLRHRSMLNRLATVVENAPRELGARH